MVVLVLAQSCTTLGFYGKRDEVASGSKEFSGVDTTELLMFTESIADHGIGKKTPLISLSPGVDADTAEALPIHGAVNMYRISDDLHDCWSNATTCDCGDGIRITQQFERIQAHQAAGLIGASGFHGRSWPDIDMLPVGPLQHGNALSDGEQRVAMTLWSIARAPMIVGTELTQLNMSSIATIANSEVIAIGQIALESFQLVRDGPAGPWGTSGAHVTWVAKLPNHAWALALFNLGDVNATINTKVGSNCSIRDLWARENTGYVSGTFSRELRPRTAEFVKLTGDECPAPVAKA